MRFIPRIATVCANHPLSCKRMTSEELIMSDPLDSSFTVREAVGVFGSGDKLEAAVQRLETAGFGREDISVMASHAAVVDNLDHRFEAIEAMEDEERPAQPCSPSCSSSLEYSGRFLMP